MIDALSIVFFCFVLAQFVLIQRLRDDVPKTSNYLSALLSANSCAKIQMFELLSRNIVKYVFKNI